VTVTSPRPRPADSAIGRASAHLLVFAAAFGLAATRRPDALLHAQFSAEGGTVFFAEAYNYGIASFFMPVPHAGYLQIFPRLIALSASLFPLSTAPFVVNVVSLVLIVLPVSFLLSSRFDLIGVPLRLLLAFGYLALPSSVEVFANLAATGVHLTLLAVMVICASPADRLGWKVFDVAVLVLFSLAGATVVLLLPLVTVVWWVRRQRWLSSQIMALLPGAAAQALVILSTLQNARTSATAPLGATPALFAEILARQMFLAPLFGMRVAPPGDGQVYVSVSVLVVLLGAAAMAYCLLKAPIELKFLIAASAVLVAAALTLPLCSTTTPQWEVMIAPGACNRYWLIPMLSFLASLVWIASTQRAWLQRAALIALLVMPVGVARDWRHPALEDHHFAARTREFAVLPRGTHMVFAIAPQGWSMELIKK